MIHISSEFFQVLEWESTEKADDFRSLELQTSPMMVERSSTKLHSHQQCMMVIFPPQPPQHLLLFVLLIIAILAGVRC